jgi:hypothetical protein
MAARVSEPELRAIVDDVPSQQVQSYIDDAHLLVEEILNPGGVSVLTEGRLALIEKYLAAHLFVLSEEKGGLTLDKIGETEERYVTTSTPQYGLRSTRFGQFILGLDTTGQLEAQLVGGSKKALFRLA